jgi:hypothetical protein
MTRSTGLVLIYEVATILLRSGIAIDDVSDAECIEEA